MIDLILFFRPPPELLRMLGIEKYFFFGKEGEGIIFSNESSTEIRRIFRKKYKKILFFGASYKDRNKLVKICREGLVDFVINPPLDDVILDFIKENNIYVVLSIRKLLDDILKKRSYPFEIIRLLKRYKIRIILSSFASRKEEMLHKNVFISFLRFFSFKSQEIKNILNKNPMDLYERSLLRRKCVLPGIYICGRV